MTAYANRIKRVILGPNRKTFAVLCFLFFLFTLILSSFFIIKHNAFNTRTYDFGRFAQAIWNVLEGRFLFTTIDYHSILGNHFSPYMALLSPLLLIWPDERLLLIIQVISVSIAGILLSFILYRRYPRLVPFFLLAFYLNPAIHSLTLFEFRRVVLIMPFLALALLALSRDQKNLMAAALMVALLGKEDIGLFVAGVALYLLLVKRDIKWGLGLMLLGLGWSIVVSIWIIPSFRTPGSEYPQLYYFSYLGSSYSEIIATLRQDPFILLRQVLTWDRLAALGRILLPLGIFLPFLAAEWLIIALPSLALLMLSGDSEIYGLLKWYPTTILPVLFAAVAVGTARAEPRRARNYMVWLLITTVLGYFLFSPLPGGRNYESELYKVTEHDRKGLEMVENIPLEASVATSPHYVPHLALREDVYHYPWIKIGLDNIDYLLFDCFSSCYPFSHSDFDHELKEYLVNPNFTLVAQSDDIFLFRSTGGVRPKFLIYQTVEQAIRLYGYDIAYRLSDGNYLELSQKRIGITGGRRLRVSLYWQSLSETNKERTISVRLEDQNGNLVAQHDGQPGNGSRPTSMWQTIQKVRDIHFLDVPPELSPGTYTIEILLYDSYSLERVPFDSGQEKIEIGEVIISPP